MSHVVTEDGVQIKAIMLRLLNEHKWDIFIDRQSSVAHVQLICFQKSNLDSAPLKAD